MAAFILSRSSAASYPPLTSSSVVSVGSADSDSVSSEGSAEVTDDDAVSGDSSAAGSSPPQAAIIRSRADPATPERTRVRTRSVRMCGSTFDGTLWSAVKHTAPNRRSVMTRPGRCRATVTPYRGGGPMAVPGRHVPDNAPPDLAQHELFAVDAYLRDFEAAVEEVDRDAGRVALSRTAFYPGGGGQPHDLGTLRWSTSSGTQT